jgi:hypothetical protein
MPKPKIGADGRPAVNFYTPPGPWALEWRWE